MAQWMGRLMPTALLLTPAVVGIGRMLMGIASFINDKILEPYVETHAIAPRMAVRVAEMQAREEALLAKEMELQAWTARLDAAEEMHRRIQFNNELWAGWISRRDAALAQGMEFNEPRPDGVRN